MASEYVLEGLFSIKSDVYGYEILMLEIIRGKKNRGFYHPECGQSLLSYVGFPFTIIVLKGLKNEVYFTIYYDPLQAWRLWNESKALELIDPNIVDTCLSMRFLRWYNIALLCIQDDPADRPTMSLVVLMLGSQAINLPQPSTPSYSVGRFTALSDLSSTSGTGTGLTSDQTSTSTSS
ncbi:hypothetical protein Dsin_027794 [Dipteronia sinensis]|uniref:Uncharacterized protein n=1 Tax=Dipteronia sinensis TaxID=43782 RepID=A0AAD9ZP44_9ROSI|nr:hypothetical protein Dsin_027794 [Dipteronia sinensis]